MVAYLVTLNLAAADVLKGQVRTVSILLLFWFLNGFFYFRATTTLRRLESEL